jgi:hypothetical protein
MNRSIDCELQIPPSLGQAEQKPAYAVPLACLLVAYAVFSLTTVFLVVVVFIPGHLGLSNLLQALGHLLPIDAPIYTT